VIHHLGLAVTDWNPRALHAKFRIAMRFDWTEYIVITAADLTAVALAAIPALLGRKWIGRKAAQVLSEIQWQHSGHLYWLASDLTWTEMQVKDGNVSKMLHGLKKSIHHATEMRLGDPLLAELRKLYEVNVGKERLSEADKAEIINRLDEIIGQAGRLAERHQGNFRPDPQT